MVIYVDVLLFVNFFVDLCLLKVTSMLAGERIALRRFIVASLVAALFSLYIFLPSKGLLLQSVMRLVSSAAAVSICFGFVSLKRFLRCFFSFYAVSFAFAGAIMGLKLLLPGSGVLINNGVVYFDIPPVVLIAMSFVIYLVILLVQKLTRKTAVSACRMKVRLSIFDKSIECVAMLDSGHSLKDAFGESMVIVIDRMIAEKLLGTAECSCLISMIPPSGILNSRFRIIPLKTVSGEKMLPAVRCDSLSIFDTEGRCVVTETYPIAVISESALGDDFSAILPTVNI